MRYGAVLLLLLALSCSSSPPLRTEAAEELDVPYATAFPEQRLDLYLPAKERFPTVLFVFGHSPLGSRKDLAPMAKELRSHGFGVALPGHRRFPRHVFPAMAEDVAEAFAWVKGHIAERGGDRSRVFVMGFGPGGHLVTLLGTNPRYLARLGLAPRDIAGVIGLSSPVDLDPPKLPEGVEYRTVPSLEDQKNADRYYPYNADAVALLRGFEEKMNELTPPPAGGETWALFGDAERLKDANPVRHVTREMPRTLLIIGDNGPFLLRLQHAAFIAEARAVGARVDLFEAEDCNGVGVVRSLAEPQSPVLMRVLAFLVGS